MVRRDHGVRPGEPRAEAGPGPRAAGRRPRRRDDRRRRQRRARPQGRRHRRRDGQRRPGHQGRRAAGPARRQVLAPARACSPRAGGSSATSSGSPTCSSRRTSMSLIAIVPAAVFSLPVPVPAAPPHPGVGGDHRHPGVLPRAGAQHAAATARLPAPDPPLRRPRRCRMRRRRHRVLPAGPPGVPDPDGVAVRGGVAGHGAAGAGAALLAAVHGGDDLVAGRPRSGSSSCWPARSGRGRPALVGRRASLIAVGAFTIPLAQQFFQFSAPAAMVWQSLAVGAVGAVVIEVVYRLQPGMSPEPERVAVAA